jgi:hypothetical protein
MATMKITCCRMKCDPSKTCDCLSSLNVVLMNVFFFFFFFFFFSIRWYISIHMCLCCLLLYYDNLLPSLLIYIVKLLLAPKSMRTLSMNAMNFIITFRSDTVGGWRVSQCYIMLDIGQMQRVIESVSFTILII